MYKKAGTSVKKQKKTSLFFVLLTFQETGCGWPKSKVASLVVEFAVKMSKCLQMSLEWCLVKKFVFHLAIAAPGSSVSPEKYRFFEPGLD